MMYVLVFIRLRAIVKLNPAGRRLRRELSD